jgi:hypothetical protein
VLRHRQECHRVQVHLKVTFKLMLEPSEQWCVFHLKYRFLSVFSRHFCEHVDQEGFVQNDPQFLTACCTILCEQPPRMMGMGPSGPSPNYQSAPQMQVWLSLPQVFVEVSVCANVNAEF